MFGAVVALLCWHHDDLAMRRLTEQGAVGTVFTVSAAISWWQFATVAASRALLEPQAAHAAPCLWADFRDSGLASEVIRSYWPMQYGAKLLKLSTSRCPSTASSTRSGRSCQQSGCCAQMFDRCFQPLVCKGQKTCFQELISHNWVKIICGMLQVGCVGPERLPSASGFCSTAQAA